MRRLIALFLLILPVYTFASVSVGGFSIDTTDYVDDQMGWIICTNEAGHLFEIEMSQEDNGIFVGWMNISRLPTSEMEDEIILAAHNALLLSFPNLQYAAIEDQITLTIKDKDASKVRFVLHDILAKIGDLELDSLPSSVPEYLMKCLYGFETVDTALQAAERWINYHLEDTTPVLRWKALLERLETTGEKRQFCQELAKLSRKLTGSNDYKLKHVGLGIMLWSVCTFNTL